MPVSPVPALLATTVRSFTPRGISASINSIGSPTEPKPAHSTGDPLLIPPPPGETNPLDQLDRLAHRAETGAQHGRSALDPRHRGGEVLRPLVDHVRRLLCRRPSATASRALPWPWRSRARGFPG